VVIKKTQFRATQRDYLLAFIVTLLVLFILMVFAWYCNESTKVKVGGARDEFVGLSKCILDPTWKKLPTAMHTATSLANFHYWMDWWVTASSLLFLGGLILLCYVMM